MVRKERELGNYCCEQVLRRLASLASLKESNVYAFTHCVDAGYSSTHKDGVSVFKIPRDPGLREQSMKQVQRFRAQWKSRDDSVLCSKHFADDCFEPGPDIAAKFGIKMARKLK